jgi:hypothetical protein
VFFFSEIINLIEHKLFMYKQEWIIQALVHFVHVSVTKQKLKWSSNPSPTICGILQLKFLKSNGNTKMCLILRHLSLYLFPSELFSWPIQYRGVSVFNATFNNISIISWQSVLLVEEIGVPGENHRPAASGCKILSHKCCIEYTSSWAGFELTMLVVIGTDCTGNSKSNYHMIMTAPPYTVYECSVIRYFYKRLFWYFSGI